MKTYVSRNCVLRGNIYLGSHVALGENSYFVSTRADIRIHDHVIFGPNVTIYTGDHPMDVVGKHISELTDVDKTDPKLDQDVVIESGCWIGAFLMSGFLIPLIIKAFKSDKALFCALMGVLVQILFLDALSNRCLWVLLCWIAMVTGGKDMGKHENNLSESTAAY